MFRRPSLQQYQHVSTPSCLAFGPSATSNSTSTARSGASSVLELVSGGLSSFVLGLASLEVSSLAFDLSPVLVMHDQSRCPRV